MQLAWRGAGRHLVVSIVFQVVAGAAVAFQLLAARSLLDAILDADRAQRGFASVVPELLTLLGVVAVGTGATVAQSEHQRVVAERVQRHVQGRIIDISIGVDLDAYERPAFFDALQRAQLGGQTRPWQMTVGLFSVLTAGVSVLGIGIALASIQPLLLPMVAVAYAPLALASINNSRATHTVASQLTPADRERSYLGSVLVSRTYAKEIRVFDLAPFLRRRYDDLYSHRISRLETLMRRRLSRSLLASILSSALGVGVLAVLVAFLLTGRLDIAAATAGALGLQQLGARLQLVYSSAGGLFEGALFLDDFNRFLALAAERVRSTPIGPAPPAFGTLEVRNVSFCYPGVARPALADVTMTIRRGEIVALVGENGSGKTTLAKLLCGLHVPTAGAILWDGVDLARCDPNTLRSAVTCIFQDFACYELSAYDNIAMGRHDAHADAARVVDASKRAGAHSFLSQLPGGYEARLGRQFYGGRELSTGQWQRVAIARAFFRDAPFLVLDEPTASLDARAEQELYETIRGLARGKTVLLISHRFSSVRSADRIFVLDTGRVVEQGTHDELMRIGGLYAELFTLQATGYLGERLMVEDVGVCGQ